MKKVITAVFLLSTAISFSQSNQIQNAINYLRNKELDKAKASADAASVHESTMNNPKAWMYRGKVYQAIYFDTSRVVRAYDLESAEKSLDSYIKCLKLDKDAVYKDEVKGPLVQATAAVSNKANAYKINKE